MIWGFVGARNQEILELRTQNSLPSGSSKTTQERNIALTNIGSRCPEVQESLDICCLIIRPKVQMQPVLDHPLVGYANEEHARCDIRCGPDLEFLVRI